LSQKQPTFSLRKHLTLLIVFNLFRLQWFVLIFVLAGCITCVWQTVGALCLSKLTYIYICLLQSSTPSYIFFGSSLSSVRVGALFLSFSMQIIPWLKPDSKLKAQAQPYPCQDYPDLCSPIFTKITPTSKSNNYALTHTTLWPTLRIYHNCLIC